METIMRIIATAEKAEVQIIDDNGRIILHYAAEKIEQHLDLSALSAEITKLLTTLQLP